MKRVFAAFLACSVFAAVFAQPLKTVPYDAGVAAYYAGDMKKARKLLMEHEYAGDAKSRFVDFLLASIAAAEGDILLAKERFPRAFKNLPENNELALARNFTKFADANGLYDFELELARPFYAENPSVFEKDSMLLLRYARALFETSDKEAAKAALLRMWELFRDDPSADGCDALLFEGDLRALALDGIKATLSPVSLERVRALKGGEGFRLPEDSGVGLALWAFHNKKAAYEDLENAIEAHPESAFAWRAWVILARRAFDDGLYDLANGFSARALSLAPDDIGEVWKVRVLQGDALRFLKRYEEAREAYQKVYMDRGAGGEASAESIYKTGLACYEEGKWNAAYLYFERVFTGFNGFDHWSSRAYYYAAKTRLEVGDNLGARNVLREYIKYSKHRDTKIFRDAQILFTNIKIN